MLFCGSMTYTFGIAFCKFSILTFYWRIFKISGIRIPIQVLFGLTFAWFLLRLFIVTLQCIPTQALWDKSITDANCSIDESTFFFSTVLTHVLIDIAILVLPGIEVRKLQLPLGQKLAVVALFTFGFMFVESCTNCRVSMKLTHFQGPVSRPPSSLWKLSSSMANPKRLAYKWGYIQHGLWLK